MPVLRTFQTDEEQYRLFKSICDREGANVGDKLTELISEYTKKHKEGNPQHLVTKWMDNEDFIGFPTIADDYSKKKAYVLKNCQEDNRLNNFGKELFGHVCQWYEELKKL